MDSDGGDQHQLVDEPGVWPDWSPDGRYILYNSLVGGNADGVVVRDADGSNRVELDTGSLSGIEEATWSPDGRQIAFVAPTGDLTSTHPPDVDENIFVMNADGTQVREVVSTVGNDHYPPSWSPDGKQLVYTAGGPTGAATDYELASVDLETLRTAQLTDNGSLEVQPTWRW